MLADQLSTIVLENISRCKVLNDFGIDYSANRYKTIEEVADNLGLDLYQLVEELSRADNYRGLKKHHFSSWTQNLIIDDLLLKQHKTVDGLKGYFINKSRSLYRMYGKDTPQLFELKDMIRNMLEDIMSHIEREENTLFPAIKHMEFKGPESTLAENALFSSIITLIQNHEHATDDVRLIEKRANQILEIPGINPEVEKFCKEVKGLCLALNQHIYIEDEILFKMVVDM